MLKIYWNVIFQMHWGFYIFAWKLNWTIHYILLFKTKKYSVNPYIFDVLVQEHRTYVYHTCIAILSLKSEIVLNPYLQGVQEQVLVCDPSRRLSFPWTAEPVSAPTWCWACGRGWWVCWRTSQPRFLWIVDSWTERMHIAACWPLL